MSHISCPKSRNLRVAKLLSCGQDMLDTRYDRKAKSAHARDHGSTA